MFTLQKEKNKINIIGADVAKIKLFVLNDYTTGGKG